MGLLEARHRRRRSGHLSGQIAHTAARAANAEYEVGLTLRAIAETSGVDDGEADEILNRLGVVSTPSIPLP